MSSINSEPTSLNCWSPPPNQTDGATCPTQSTFRAAHGLHMAWGAAEGAVQGVPGRGPPAEGGFRVIVFSSRRGFGCGGCLGAIVLLFLIFGLLSAMRTGTTPTRHNPPVNINPATATPTGGFSSVVRTQPNVVKSGEEVA